MLKIKKQEKPKYDINWYADKYQSAMVWRNWMLLIVLLSLLSVLAMTAAAMFFVPLKTVKPFVVQINEKTGATEVVSGRSIKDFSANEEMIKFFALSYIRAREAYIIAPNYDGKNSLLDYNSEVVRIMSARDVFSLYRQQTSLDNPSSPVNIYRDNTQKQIFLRSFQVLSKDEDASSFTVQARMDVLESSTNKAPVQYSVVVLLSGNFSIDLLNGLSEKERLINPIGFTVTSYRIDREV